MNHPEFDRLLQAFDADRTLAAQRYERLRSRLIKFFTWEGSAFPEDFADETINRLAKRINEGLEIVHLEQYTLGVARLVFKEELRERQKTQTALSELPANTAAFKNPGPEEDMVCLERCLDELPPESHDFILKYYLGNERTRIESRKELARRMSLSVNAVRNRALRLREKLEACVKRCLHTKEIR